MLSPEHALWLAGYLHGVRQTQAAPAIATTPTSPSAATREGQSGDDITVFFASQTGNAMKVALQGFLAATASVRGLPAVAVSASDYRPSDLRNEKNLVMISSTRARAIRPMRRPSFTVSCSASAHPLWLACATRCWRWATTATPTSAKRERTWISALGELGAQRMLDRVDCDVEYQSAAEAWQEERHRRVRQAARPRHRREASLTSQPAPGPATVPDQGLGQGSSLFRPGHRAVTLNGRGSGKKTVHLELSLAGSGISYQPGDALGVMPRNAPAYLEQF